MFDSHIHLDFPEFAENRAQLLSSAREVGVSACVVPGCHQEQWSQLRELTDNPALQVHEIYFGVGQHPYWSEGIADLDALCSSIALECSQMGAVCIGECGIDHGRGASLPEQAALFEAQLCLADDLDLPVVVHQVGAQELFLKCLKRAGFPRAGGVVHGFSGASDWGRALIKHGFYLGFGLSLLVEKRSRLARAAGELPLDRLLLETDAPDQRPPGEDRIGEPADLALVCDKLANIRGETKALIDEVTERNARNLFRVEPPAARATLPEIPKAEVGAFTRRSPGGLFLL